MNNKLRSSIKFILDVKIIIIADIDGDLHLGVSVLENGPGISEDSLDKIFIRFYTTREKGLGIGLSISGQIMRVHYGNLKVRSVPGKETVFSMSF